jgi:hypothetical protein
MTVCFWLTLQNDNVQLSPVALTDSLAEENCMLVTFTTDAYADITMFGDVAVALLKMMGHSGTVPSAILAEDVPAALKRLSSAIEAEKVSPPVEDEKDEEEPPVSMATRAIPLINLLTAAAEAGSDVTWK